MDNLYLKYKKYKSKYLELKQKGGDFEVIHDRFVTFATEYNRTHLGNSIIHIKGGASTKHHLKSRGINTAGITSDIDIFLIDKTKLIDTFSKDFNAKFSDYTITGGWNNGLYMISLNGVHYIDLTLFVYQEYDDSVFAEVCKLMDKKTIDYVRELTALGVDNLEEITFTSILFEFYATSVRYEMIQNRVNEISEKRRKIMEEYLPRFEEQKRIYIVTPSEGLKQTIKNSEKFIAKEIRFSSDEYLSKLEKKLERDAYKISCLHGLLPPVV